MVKKIALEEHCLCPGFEDYWKLTVGDVDPAIYSQVVARLSDFGELRLAAMDRARCEPTSASTMPHDF
jgi:2,3-dihydroxybenzoate decarboxylase